MKRDQVIKKLHNAYYQLLNNDAYLLSVDANERSITHKLAEYLQVEFSDWNVDCEYNRNGIDVKRLDTFKRKIESNDTNAVSVYPDIIIHHRDTSDNLVVIEAKKSNNSDEYLDEEKLRAYKNDLGYSFAFKVVFPIADDFSENLDILSNIQEIL